ncbi:unnamed protein product [Ectocarpus fasciculatus]
MWANMRSILGVTVLPMFAADVMLNFAKGEGDQGVIAVRGGVVVQDKGCPHAITPEDADIRKSTPSWPGGVVTLMPLNAIGRSGNHYMAISTVFSMAFCCQVKVLELPNMDIRLPTESGKKLRPSTNLFSFASGNNNHRAGQQGIKTGFEGLQGRSDVCPQERVIDGKHANHMTELHPDLQTCMSKVKMRGCEAVYFQESLGGEDSCSTPRRQLTADEKEPGSIVTGSSSPLERKGAGSLVLHIRSGDVFRPGTEAHHYGQPPLLFILAVIASNKWDSLIFLTSGQDEDGRLLNPTFRVIEEFISQEMLGTNGTNVEMHKERSFWEDLQTMLCADSLAFAHSTLTNLLLAHSRAKKFFLPWGCEPQIGGTALNRFANASMICLQRPEVEVYGIEWRTTSDAYTVYNHWVPSSNQLEMVVSDAVKGIRHCCN